MVYSLNLAGGKNYIGKTDNIEKRLTAHFLGHGSQWSQKHQPLSVNHIQIYRTPASQAKACTQRCEIIMVLTRSESLVTRSLRRSFVLLLYCKSQIFNICAYKSQHGDHMICTSSEDLFLVCWYLWSRFEYIRTIIYTTIKKSQVDGWIFELGLSLTHSILRRSLTEAHTLFYLLNFKRISKP